MNVTLGDEIRRAASMVVFDEWGRVEAEQRNDGNLDEESVHNRLMHTTEAELVGRLRGGLSGFDWVVNAQSSRSSPDLASES